MHWHTSRNQAAVLEYSFQFLVHRITIGSKTKMSMSTLSEHKIIIIKIITIIKRRNSAVAETIHNLYVLVFT